MVRRRETRHVSWAYHSVTVKLPCPSGWPFDSVYEPTAPRRTFAMPMLVLRGFADSALKLRPR